MTNAEQTPEVDEEKVNGTANTDGAESSPDSLSSALKLIAEVSAGLAFVGFLISICLHILVFNQWRIDFLHVASPSDVLMSGMGFAIGMGIPLLFSIAFVVGATTVISKLEVSDRSKFMKAVTKLTTSKAVKVIYVIAAILLLLIIWRILSGPDLPYYFITMEDNPDREITNVLVYIGVILIGFGVSATRKQERSHRSEDSSGIAILTVYLGLGFVVLFAFSFINIQAAQGFQRSRTIVDDPTVCNGNGRVLWIGSQSTIVRCEMGGPRPEILILQGSQSKLRVSPTPGSRPS